MKSIPAVSIALLLSLSLTSCESFDRAEGPTGIELTRSELGGLSNTTEWGEFYMGGQPTAADLELAAKRGVTRVINIRTDFEVESVDYNEGDLSAELGMEYIHVPVSWASMTDAKFDSLMQLVNAETDGKTLFHCASGNRVSVFVAAHRVIEAGVSYDDALKDARTAGMKPTSKPILDGQIARLTEAN
jgi:uncharacterized protein (TIGR01244 family)